MKKKLFAILLSLCMVITMMPVAAGVAWATENTGNTAPSSGYWTDVAGLKAFNLKEDSTVGKIIFGQNGSGSPQLWKIAGPDTEISEDKIILFADSALGTSVFQEESVYWDQDQYDYKVMKYNASWNCAYPAGTEMTNLQVNPNHYGASVLRQTLNGYIADTNYFSEPETSKMNSTTISTHDTKNDVDYTVTDKLYVPSFVNAVWDCIYVGASNIPIHVSKLVDCTNFWMRPPEDEMMGYYLKELHVDSDNTIGAAIIEQKGVEAEKSVVPAFDLNLSTVSFASAAGAASSTGYTANNAMEEYTYTLRYKSNGEESAVISADGSKINVEKANGKYLMVQNGNGVYALAINSDSVTVNARDITMGSALSNFDNCKVWIESTADRITTAKLAKRISLNKASTTINKGSTEKLTAIISSDDPISTVTWSSNNESVATVSNDGTVKAVGLGKATITAKLSDSMYATCEVTVACPHTAGTEWKYDDTNHWHICTAAGCGAVIEATKAAHTDTSTKDHKCDTCGKEMSKCADNDKNHNCDTCGKELSKCADENKDHSCDYCKKVMTTCSGNLEHTDAKAATTSEAGNTEYWHCTVCGKYFSDENATKQIEKDSWIIAKITHSGGGSSSATTDNVINTAENKATATQAKTTATIKTETKSETKTDSTAVKTTTATIDSRTADKIVDKAVANKSKEVVINTESKNTITEVAAGTKTEVAIPAETVGEIAEKTEAEVIIKTDAAEVVLDKKTVETVAEKAGTTGEVKLVVDTVARDDNKVQVELKLVSANGNVTEFKGGNVSVTIKLGNSLSQKSLVCVYIDDYGTYHKVDGQKNVDKTYTFKTTHFSSYVVMAESKADAIIAQQNANIEKHVKAITLKARSSKTKKGNIKVNLKVSSDEIKAIESLGYTVAYKFYRSTKKSSSYKAKIEKASKAYTNTTGKKGTRYYYKARVMVYDSEGTLIAKTALKQCKYAARIK